MRHHLTFFVVLAAVASVGCPLSEAPTPIVALDAKTSEPIEDLVARTLLRNRTHRQLASDTHGAWQILHGVLAYGQAFSIRTPEGERPIVQYLLEGGSIDGFEPIAGDILGAAERPGMRIAMQPVTKIGQGHRDQWLAIFAQCGLPLNTKLRAGDRTFTIDDWLRQAEYDVPRNLELEFSWSLIALASYRNTEHRWMARDGVEYSFTDLVNSEVNQSIEASVCGGTHRLIGIAMSLDRRRQEGQPISGVWGDADQLVSDAILSAKENQNADGSYSVAYLHRPGLTRDLGESLGTTGHVLEFLAFAAPDQVLIEPWVERSVRRICRVLEQCEDIDLECGVLYHALHGLDEYLKRIQSIERDATESP